MIQRVPEFVRPNYGEALMKFVSDRSWKTVLEFGTCTGESALAFALAGAEVITFDNLTDVSHGCTSPIARKNFRRYDMLCRINMVIGDDRHLPLIDGLHWDLVYIDTTHMFEHTLFELTYAKEVTDNILLDDIVWAERSIDGGTPRAIRSFLDCNSNWRFVALEQIPGVGWFYRSV